MATQAELDAFAIKLANLGCDRAKAMESWLTDKTVIEPVRADLTTTDLPVVLNTLGDLFAWAGANLGWTLRDASGATVVFPPTPTT